MHYLIKDESVPLNSAAIVLYVDCGSREIKVLLLGLDQHDRISDERYSVMPSSPNTPNGEIQLTRKKLSYGYKVDLGKIPEKIGTLLFVAFSDQPICQNFPLALTIEQPQMSFNLGQHIGAETMLILAKLNRQEEQWTFTATGVGYDDGIDHFLATLGVSAK